MTTKNENRLALVGAGNMAEALARGWIDAKLCRPDDLLATDPSEQRRSHFRHTFGIRTEPENAAARGVGVLVLAVKPQVMDEVLSDLRGTFDTATRVISIAAGISTRRIEAGLAAKARVIRAMPNTPALVGAGITAVCRGRYAEENDLDRAERLLRAVGRVVRVAEASMDAVTALSGSGPAYVFYLVEAWLKAARRLGLNEKTARVLTEETLAGAARLLAETGKPPDELRRRVTSKGGTTEAALRVLESQNVGRALEAAVEAAATRARELSGPDTHNHPKPRNENP